jgi:hypothetical protein
VQAATRIAPAARNLHKDQAEMEVKNSAQSLNDQFLDPAMCGRYAELSL